MTKYVVTLGEVYRQSYLIEAADEKEAADLAEMRGVKLGIGEFDSSYADYGYKVEVYNDTLPLNISLSANEAQLLIEVLSAVGGDTAQGFIEVLQRRLYPAV